MARWAESAVVAMACGVLVAVPYVTYWRPRTARNLLKIRLENVELRLLKLELAGNSSADVRRLLERVRAIQCHPASACTSPMNAVVSLSNRSARMVEIARAYDSALGRFRRDAGPWRRWLGGSRPWPSALTLVDCPRASGCPRTGRCPLAAPSSAGSADVVLPGDEPAPVGERSGYEEKCARGNGLVDTVPA